MKDVLDARGVRPLGERSGLMTRQRLRNRGLFFVWAAAAIIMASILPSLLSPYWVYLASEVVIFAIATLGLDLLFGRTGQLSLAHASFMGLGAYTAAVGTAMGMSVWYQVPLVFVVSIVAGVVVAVPTLRLSGLRLALVTLLFGELFTWAVIQAGGLTGGSEGMSVPALDILSFSTGDATQGYYLVVSIGFIASLCHWQLRRSQFGRAMLAVRDSEMAANSVGVNIVKTKVATFILAAVFASVAGFLYSYIVGFVSPSTFGLFPSVYFLVAVILGGAGSGIGSWLGACYLVLVPQIFTMMGRPNLFPIVGGAILVGVALLLPGGLVGGARRLKEIGLRAAGANRGQPPA